jgi:hypothetical protein
MFWGMLSPVMTPGHDYPEWSAKTLAGNILVKAVGLSVAIHLVVWAAYGPLKRMHWEGYDRLVQMLTPKPGKLAPTLMTWLTPKPKPKPVAKEKQLMEEREIQVVMRQEVPDQFLAVDPLRATAEPPPTAKYYSDKNSQAANPRIKKPSDQPNLEGKQTQVPFTEDVPRKKLTPELVQNLQPSPPDKQASVEKSEKPVPEGEQTQEQQAEQKMRPRGGETLGQMAMARPVEIKQVGDGVSLTARGDGDKNQEKKDARNAKAARPRTLAEARSRMQDNTVAGQKMQQEGGVQNKVEFSALDAKATPFGAYDSAIVAAIQKRWDDLLEENRFSGDAKGRVVLEFRLHSDGRISNMTEVESSVKAVFSILCSKAVTDPAPYAKWTPEMLRFFTGDYRDVRFTFLYN